MQRSVFNCSMAECFPGKSSLCENDQVCQRMVVLYPRSPSYMKLQNIPRMNLWISVENSYIGTKLYFHHHNIKLSVFAHSHHPYEFQLENIFKNNFFLTETPASFCKVTILLTLLINDTPKLNSKLLIKVKILSLWSTFAQALPANQPEC